jgi:sirohydrochlorin ferrochelatase
MKAKAILLVDHGSRLDEANQILVAVAGLVAREDPRYHVEAAHMELAGPTIAQGFAACVAAGASDITVHPYMLGPGRHATRDIPRLVAEAAAAHPGIAYRVTEPLGLDPLLARVVLDRVRAAELRDAESLVGGRKEST